MDQHPPVKALAEKQIEHLQPVRPGRKCGLLQQLAFQQRVARKPGALVEQPLNGGCAGSGLDGAAQVGAAVSCHGRVHSLLDPLQRFVGVGHTRLDLTHVGLQCGQSLGDLVELAAGTAQFQLRNSVTDPALQGAAGGSCRPFLAQVANQLIAQGVQLLP